MFRRLLTAAALAVSCFSQLTNDKIIAILQFEAPPVGTYPGGWGGGPRSTIRVETDGVHGGKQAACIERTSKSPGKFSTLTMSVPMDFIGKRLELHGFLRTENVRGFAGLWMREDQGRTVVAFDNMEGKHLAGTKDWKEYSIKLPIAKEAESLYLGVLLSGTGKLWVDDLELLVDGEPRWTVGNRN